MPGALSAEAVLDVLHAGVLVIAPDGLVGRANREAAKILRRPVAEIVGCPIANVLVSLPELLAVGEQRGERTVRRGDGTLVSIGFSLSPADDGRGTSHPVVLFREITTLLELRKQRDRLLQTAVLAELMPTLLHDVRNPLAAMSTMLELLAEEAEPRLAGELRDVLALVGRIALSLQGIARHHSYSEEVRMNHGPYDPL